MTASEARGELREERRKHAAWLRECAQRAELLAAEYRANADRFDALAANDQPDGAR